MLPNCLYLTQDYLRFLNETVHVSVFLSLQQMIALDEKVSIFVLQSTILVRILAIEAK